MRYEQEKLIYSNFQYNENYRLMPEDQVPDWIKIKEQPKKTVLAKRRNCRERYNEHRNLDESSEDEKKKKRESQRRKRKSKGAKNSRKSSGKSSETSTVHRITISSKLQAVDSLKKIVKTKNSSEKDDIFVDSDEEI